MKKTIKAILGFQAQSRVASFALIGTVLLLCFSNAMAQAGSKEAKKFLDYSQDARDSLTDAKSELGSTVALYNMLIAGEAEKPESTYKKLVKSLEKSEKVAEKTGDRVEKMQKQADKVFNAWAEGLESFEDESLKELGVQRMDASKQRYDEMIERMSLTGEAYRPLVSSLNDQVKFMGFDLSPAAMTALQGPAQETNAMAEELFARIDAVLNQEQQDEAAIGGQGDAPTDQSDAPTDQSDAPTDQSDAPADQSE
jgi:hypothetical protein